GDLDLGDGIGGRLARLGVQPPSRSCAEREAGQQGQCECCDISHSEPRLLWSRSLRWPFAAFAVTPKNDAASNHGEPREAISAEIISLWHEHGGVGQVRG